MPFINVNIYLTEEPIACGAFKHCGQIKPFRWPQGFILQRASSHELAMLTKRRMMLKTQCFSSFITTTTTTTAKNNTND